MGNEKKGPAQRNILSSYDSQGKIGLIGAEMRRSLFTFYSSWTNI